MKTTLTDFELALAHKYKGLSGEIYPSVTTVLHCLDWDGKSGRMAGAAAKITRKGGDYRTEWNEAAKRGTRIHDACENWLYGDDAKVEPEDTGYVSQLAHFFEDNAIKPIAVEQVILSGLGYGGRFDFIAEWNGINTLFDVKSGKQYPLEHTMQLAAYAHSDGMAAYDTSGALTKIDPLPTIQQAGCLYVSEDSYSFVQYPIHDGAFAAYKSLLVAYQSVKALEKELA